MCASDTMWQRVRSKPLAATAIFKRSSDLVATRGASDAALASDGCDLAFNVGADSGRGWPMAISALGAL
jgi:hypothetical protein